MRRRGAVTVPANMPPRKNGALTWVKRLPFAPWVMALGVCGLAGLIVLNIAAAEFGPQQPWLQALDLVMDITVLGAGVFAIARLAMRAEARDARMREELSDSEARLAAVVETAMDAIITVDGEQNVVLFNRASEEVFRCRREDVIGAPLERLLPQRFRGAHRGHLRRFAEDQVTSRRMGDATALAALRADGSEFPIEASISHVTLHGKAYFTVILRDVTLRKHSEEALVRQQQELRELSAQALEAREEEKTLIARELHDELGQLLTALKMDLAWLRERLPAAEDRLADKARQMSELLDRTVASVRRISADLRPLMLDDLGLADAAGWLVEDFARRSGVECRIDLAPQELLDALERDIAIAVYRVLQESLTNIARHAGAEHAWMSLELADGELRLEIEDDGCGIAPEDLTKARSLGLKGMRERAHYLGGAFDVSRAPRGGTRVRLRLPLRTQRPEEAAA
jgi:PAS domain S-box-containing protein